MPYLTPQELPESDDCRSLSIPADSEWLALFGGALTELEKSYNWEYSGGLTVDETVAKMREIINNWYTESCASCTLPGGGKIIRIGAHGHIEELGDDSTWGEPTGDYVIPPPSARSGGTATDQNCLAAKNATNVLQQLYETLSEAWASHLSEAEAGTEFIIAAGALIGFEFAPITLAIVAFLEVVFAALYTALEYLGADLWDSSFTDQMVCFLVDCALNDAGVVTFDWDCFMARLNSLTDSFGLSEIQLRLYLQVGYMLYFIGGVDGLNLAARTTDITNDDCSNCGAWCLVVDLTDNDGGFISDTVNVPAGAHYTAGVGWEQNTSGNTTGTYILLNLPITVELNHIEFDYIAFTHTTQSTIAFGTGYSYPVVHNETGVGNVLTTPAWDGDQTGNQLAVQMGNSTTGTGGTSTISRVLIRGIGDKPVLTGWVNCD